MGVYYLTYACGFRCPHCCDGSGTPYPNLKATVLPAKRILELLRILRNKCDYLVITGGEPLHHPEFLQVMDGLPELNFRGVILTTNGYSAESVIPVLAKSVHDLVFSLQTMNSSRADAWYGAKPGAHSRIVENIDRAAHLPKRKYEIIISSVVTPENIDDLYDVYAYTRRNRFRLAACPQLIGVKAHEELAKSDAYRRFYDFLIAEKMKGARIQGTVDYLGYMRDLRKFECRPFTMVTVSPNGDVFYPCLEMGRVCGNLFDEPDLHQLRRVGQEKYGPQPRCGNQCHSACALGFSRLLANPLSAVHEGVLMTRSAVKSLFQAGPASSSDNNPRGLE